MHSLDVPDARPYRRRKKAHASARKTCHDSCADRAPWHMSKNISIDRHIAEAATGSDEIGIRVVMEDY